VSRELSAQFTDRVGANLKSPKTETRTFPLPHPLTRPPHPEGRTQWGEPTRGRPLLRHPRGAAGDGQAHDPPLASLLQPSPLLNPPCPAGPRNPPPSEIHPFQCWNPPMSSRNQDPDPGEKPENGSWERGTPVDRSAQPFVFEVSLGIKPLCSHEQDSPPTQEGHRTKLYELHCHEVEEYDQEHAHPSILHHLRMATIETFTNPSQFARGKTRPKADGVSTSYLCIASSVSPFTGGHNLVVPV